MNYTENYHLPQWEESDRIMRVDFNGAMANLENGLTGSAGENQKSLDRFCRMAYNHYRMVQDMDPVPRQIGMFRQDPAKDAAGVTGMQLLNGIQSTWNCPGTLTADALTQSYHQLTQVHVEGGNPAASSPLTATFKPPASGKSALLLMTGGYTNNNSAPNSARFRVTLINQDAGIVELTRDITIPLEGFASAISRSTFNFTLTFLGGVNYLFKVEALDAVCDMDLKFSPFGEAGLETYKSGGTADASWTIHEPESGEGGMVILHYGMHGAGGKLRFFWDGEEREPHFIRRAPSGDGQNWQELVYLRTDPIAEDSTLSLHFDCAEGGSFQFYDWGAMLF